VSAENRRGRPQVLSDDALLDYALDAFGRLGFDGVSLRALNRELAASPAMLGKRFIDTGNACWPSAAR
jgi:AcrR family transcriptional regulator